jgi:hypothetical protein
MEKNMGGGGKEMTFYFAVFKQKRKREKKNCKKEIRQSYRRIFFFLFADVA